MTALDATALAAHLRSALDEIERLRAETTPDMRAAAKASQATLDLFMSGQPITNDVKAQVDRLCVAASFASAALLAAGSGGHGTHAMLRAFLLALHDPMHPDLDYLRAKPAASTALKETDNG